MVTSSLPPASGTPVRRTRVVVADDHPIFAELMQAVLQRVHAEVVGIATDGETAVTRCEELKPDIILLDLVLPKMGGLEVLQRLRRLEIPTKVILFTGSFSPDVLREAMVCGLEGCIVKTSSIDEIVRAFERVRDGHLAFGPEASEAMRQIVLSQDDSSALTDLETAVLRQVAQGRAVKEMASELSLSESGVYKVVDRVKRKLGAQSVQELTLSAVRRRLVSV
jgi:DNA-binding NarL/FixJ family response regulator